MQRSCGGADRRPPSMPLVAQGVREQTFINPAYFKEDFSVDSFLLQLTRDVIEALVDGSTPAPSSIHPPAPTSPAGRNTFDPAPLIHPHILSG